MYQNTMMSGKENQGAKWGDEGWRKKRSDEDVGGDARKGGRFTTADKVKNIRDRTHVHQLGEKVHAIPG